MEDLVVAALPEVLGGARAGEADRDDAVVQVLDLGVLAQQQPGEPPHGLDALEHARPQPTDVDQGEARRRLPEGRCGGGGGGIGSARGVAPGSPCGGRRGCATGTGGGFARRSDAVGAAAGGAGADPARLPGSAGAGGPGGTSGSRLRRTRSGGRSSYRERLRRRTAGARHGRSARPGLRRSGRGRAAGCGRTSSRAAVAARWRHACRSGPWLTMSAARVSSARPKRAAWPVSRSAWSCGTSMIPRAAASGTADTTTRSRSRCSRSSAKRRGSWPVSMTFSMTPKSVPPSSAASASTVSSSRLSGV